MNSLTGIMDIARTYVHSSDSEEQASLRKEIDAYEGHLEEIVAHLRPSPPAKAETGLIMARPFRTERLARRNRGETFSCRPKGPGGRPGCCCVPHESSPTAPECCGRQLRNPL